MGGSMGASAKRILNALGIPSDAITWYLADEDPRFHRVGESGKEIWGAEVARDEVCATTGAPGRLLRGEADFVLLWDPDGDRLNIMTTAPVSLKQRANDFGVVTGPDNGRRMVVYVTPNQLYLLLMDFRIQLLSKSGLLSKYNWFVGTTFPSAMAIEELARQDGLPTVRVPGGFKNLVDLCRSLEGKRGTDQVSTALTGQRIPFGL